MFTLTCKLNNTNSALPFLSSVFPRVYRYERQCWNLNTGDWSFFLFDGAIENNGYMCSPSAFT